MSIFKELKRRNVFRVAIAYLIIAWLVMQVADLVLGNIGAPAWVMQTLFFLLAIGFVISVVISWAYELTEDGIKKEREVDRSKSITHQTAKKLDYITLAALLTVGGMVFWQQFIAGPSSGSKTEVSAIASTSSESLPVGSDAEEDSIVQPVVNKSIAVLPFVDMSADKNQDYFSDGISEEILHVLTKIPELKVAGRTSSFKFKNINEDLRVIGETLGVAHILEGSVRKQDNKVRVTAQLIRASDGFHLWSQTFDRELTDVFAIQDEISQAVAKSLTLTLNIGSSHASTENISPHSYDLYLQARQLLAKRGGENLLKAIKLFEAVTLVAPEFDEAYSGMARALSLLWHYAAELEDNTFIDKALVASQKALTLNDKNAEAYSVLSILYGAYIWDWEQSKQQLEMAIKYGGNDAEIANFAGDLYGVFGDLDSAMLWEKKALELDPLHAINHSDVGVRYSTQQDCSTALQFYTGALEIDKDLVPAITAHIRANSCLGNWQESEKGIKLLESKELYFLANNEKIYLAFKRDDKTALEALKEPLLKQSADQLYRQYPPAILLALLGEYEASATALQRAYAARDPIFVIDDWFLLPEEWTNHPEIQAVFEQPGLKELYQMRRKYLSKSGYRGQ